MVILVNLISVLMVYAIDTVNEGFRSDTGATVEVDAHDKSRKRIGCEWGCFKFAGF